MQMLIEKEKVEMEVVKPTEPSCKDFPERVINRFMELGIMPKYSVNIRNSEALQDNHLYVSDGSESTPLEFNIIGSINVKIDMSTPNIYEELIKHLELEKFWDNGKEINLPLYDIGKVELYTVGNINTNGLNSYEAIRITLNKTHTMGYYLPKDVWPQILEKLNLT